MITICPLNQFNVTKMTELGYQDKTNFLFGFYMKKFVVSWGAEQNLSFDKLLEEMLNLNEYPCIEMNIDSGGLKQINYEPRFYPMYGRCFDVFNYTASETVELAITIDNKINSEAEIFLTDRKLRTMNTVHTISHLGPSIIVQHRWTYNYMVKVELLSNYNPLYPDDCKEYSATEFEQCVDDKLQDFWKPVIKCNPPWLSKQDQCMEAVNITDENLQVYNNKEIQKTVLNIQMMKDFSAKYNCTKPCTVTKLNIFVNGKEDNSDQNSNQRAAFLNLKFDNLVVKRTKQISYRFSDFLIDLGSSLGLCFGLSVFGITDLGIMALQWGKTLRQNEMKKLLKLF